jgi:hypothetical protein
MYNRNTKLMSTKSILFFFIVSVLFLDACKKNNYAVDLDTTKEIEEYAQFAPADRRLFRYFPIDNKNTPFKIPVGFTNISSKNREIKFEFSSKKAVRDKDYKSSSSIIIPAGKVTDSLQFTGLYSAYPIGKKDTIKIKILGARTLDRRDSFEIVLERYCDVNISDLIGEFANTREFRSNGNPSYGPYSTFVDNLVATGSTSAEGFFVNLYDEGWNDIKFTMDWSDPANFIISIPRQATGKTGEDDIQFVRSAAGRTNTFSSCSKTFTISLDLLGGDNDNVVSSGYTIILAN